MTYPITYTHISDPSLSLYHIGGLNFSLRSLPIEVEQIKYNDGSSYYKSKNGGFYHREDGPSLPPPTYPPQYHLHGFEVSKEDFEIWRQVKKENMEGYSSTTMNPTITTNQQAETIEIHPDKWTTANTPPDSLKVEEIIAPPGVVGPEGFPDGSGPTGPHGLQGVTGVHAPSQHYNRGCTGPLPYEIRNGISYYAGTTIPVPLPHIEQQTKQAVYGPSGAPNWINNIPSGLYWTPSFVDQLNGMKAESDIEVVSPPPSLSNAIEEVKSLAENTINDEEIDYSKYYKQIKENVAKSLSKVDTISNKQRYEKKQEEQKNLSFMDRSGVKLVDIVKAPIKPSKLAGIPSQKDKIIPSYDDIQELVRDLISLGIVVEGDFFKQVVLTGKWKSDRYLLIKEMIDGLVDGVRTFSDIELEKTMSELENVVEICNKNIKTSIIEGDSTSDNLKSYSIQSQPGFTDININDASFHIYPGLTESQKNEILTLMFEEGLTENILLSINTPELTQEDVQNWIDKSDLLDDELPFHNKKDKKSKTTDEVAKINRMISESNLEVKDLDKYAALGILTTAGVKAWRIEDQAKNDYWYQQVSDEMPKSYAEDKDLLDLLDQMSFRPSQFETEVHKTAYRVAATQLNNITRASILKIFPEDKMEGMKTLLQSEFGNSFVSMMGGLILTHSMENNNIAQNLAKELRVSGLTILGNEMTEMLFDSISGTIKNAIEGIKEDELVATEISTQNEEIEEELIIESEKQSIEDRKMLN